MPLVESVSPFPQSVALSTPLPCSNFKDVILRQVTNCEAVPVISTAEVIEAKVQFFVSRFLALFGKVFCATWNDMHEEASATVILAARGFEIQ